MSFSQILKRTNTLLSSQATDIPLPQPTIDSDIFDLTLFNNGLFAGQEINLLAGDDRLTLQNVSNSTIIGGDGNDTIIINGTLTNAYIAAGLRGVVGSGAFDTLILNNYAEADVPWYWILDNELIFSSEDGGRVLGIFADFDKIVFKGGVTANFYGNYNTILGTNASEFLWSNPGTTSINAKGGNDTISFEPTEVQATVNGGTGYDRLKLYSYSTSNLWQIERTKTGWMVINPQARETLIVTGIEEFECIEFNSKIQLNTRGPNFISATNETSKAVLFGTNSADSLVGTRFDDIFHVSPGSRDLDSKKADIINLSAGGHDIVQFDANLIPHTNSLVVTIRNFGASDDNKDSLLFDGFSASLIKQATAMRNGFLSGTETYNLLRSDQSTLTVTLNYVAP